MTPRQIAAKLQKAGFNMEYILNVSRDEIEVAVLDDDGYAEPEKTNRQTRRALKILGVNWGGFMTGYGGQVRKAGYVPRRTWNVR